MAKKSSENCEGRKGKDRRGEVLEEKEEDEASDVNDGMEDDEETRQIILVEEGEESEILTKSQKKELKRLKNLEWKWHRGENDPNPRHTEYYRQQLPELHEEWARFQETMAKDLPVTFRLCTKRNSFVCSILKSKLLTEFRQMKGRFTTVRDAVVKEVVTPVNWCSDTWQVNCDSTTLAKDEAFTPLHSLLMREIRSCHLVRQELVSMIPAILLDPQSHHCTLDMCAAPGSKTEQLISRVCVSSAGEIISGLVVANDADPKRLATLRRRYEACRYPNLVFTCAKADQLQQVLGSRFPFERVLCDVPCTGDGTFRKSPHLWRLFRPRFAAELHPLQLDIARRGVELMRAAHSERRHCRLVYSTCSLNPIEDEAVVAALLTESWCAGLNLQLMDPATICSGDSSVPLLTRHLPGIRWRAGVSEWLADAEIMLAGEVDAKEREESRARLPPLSRSMRSPQSLEMRRELSLERCMRVFPQDMDTGGFFIAVLEISEAPVSDRQMEALRNEELVPREGQGKGCSKKRGADQAQELSGEKKMRSMKTFQALGYNPCPTPEALSTQPHVPASRKKSTGEWSQKSEAFHYCQLRPEDTEAMLRTVGCVLPSSSSPLPFSLLLEEAPPAPAAIAATEAEKKRKRSSHRPQSQPRPSHYLSILSPSVARLVELSNSAAPFVVQAGVRVADLSSDDATSSLVSLSRDREPPIALNQFGGLWALTLLGGRVIEMSNESFKSLLARKLSAADEKELQLQARDKDVEQLEALPWNTYALISTEVASLPLQNTVSRPSDPSAGKRRMSKAERKRCKAVLGAPSSSSSERSQYLISSTEQLSSVPTPHSSLSVVVRKVRGEGQLAIYEVTAPRETVESYYESLSYLARLVH